MTGRPSDAAGPAHANGPMTDTETLRQLTAALYEAALDPDRLPVFLRELSDVVGADASVLAAGAPGETATPTSVAHGVDGASAAALTALLDPQAAPNPKDPAAWREALGDPAISDSMAVTTTPLDGGGDGFLALLRRQGSFDPPERADLERFRPHLPHALRLLRAVDATSRDGEAACFLGDIVGHALAVVGRDGQVVAGNRAFQDLIAAGDGLALAEGRLVLTATAPQETFLALLAQATGRLEAGQPFSGGAVSVPRKRSERPLGVVVTPLPSRGQEQLFGLHISALETTPAPPIPVLRGLFDLTPAEAALLQALIADQRIEDVAEARGVSVTTVRTQLAHLFRKTNTNRQPELVRLATLAACCVSYPEA